MAAPLAHALFNTQRENRAVEDRVKALLDCLFPLPNGWRGWTSYGETASRQTIEVFCVRPHPVPIRALHLAAFYEVVLHDHPSRLSKCDCKRHEMPRRII